MLTVSDGSHTAQIALVGDFLSATFTAGGDGHGGTDIVATSQSIARAHRFISASAALVAGLPGPVLAVHESSRESQAILGRPRTVIA